MPKRQVRNCLNKSGKGINLYCFPKEVGRRKLWINACGGAEFVKNAENGIVLCVHK